MVDPLVNAIENLARFHRDHEKFYAQQPRADAVALQRHSRTLTALADRWSVTVVSPRDPLNPFEGSEDLNALEAIQLDGVLFMEGEGEPTELHRLRQDLRRLGTDSTETGAWLAAAMERTWEAAPALMGYDQLADLLGDRHRVIANDWQAAAMSSLAGRILHRAADVLDLVELTPAAVRADLDGARVVPGYLYSAAELVDRAADLLSDSAGLVHDNERRWRLFHQRVVGLLEGSDGARAAPIVAPSGDG
jgi:hypothetical protein